MERNIRELDFLNLELEKINLQIKLIGYGAGVMSINAIDSQVKLWELKEKIEGKIKILDNIEDYPK